MKTFILMGFYISFAINFYLALYALYLNSKRNINKIFSCLLFSFAIWAFSFFMSNFSDSIDTALIWRRYSVLGWGVAYSIMLHFTLVLTERSSLLNKISTYIFLYGPSIFNIFYFGLNTETVEKVYNLTPSAYGWIYVSSNTPGDIFFNFYYAIFSLLNFILLYKWFKNTKNTNEKKQAKHLLYSLLAVTALGTITDIIFNSYSKIKIPSLAPIIFMILSFSIFYSIKKYNLLKHNNTYYNLENKHMLSAGDKNHFHGYISVVFLIISAGTVLHYVLKQLSFYHGLQFSLVLLFIGAVILLIPETSLSNENQENFLISLIVISIPYILLKFANQYGSNILWVFSFIMIVVSIPFKNKKLFYWVLSSSIFSVFLSWYNSPKFIVEIGSIDYISRILFLAILGILVKYINDTFIKRLLENEKQIEFQNLLVRITEKFLNVKSENFDSYIDLLLKDIGPISQAKSIQFLKHSTYFDIDTNDSILIALKDTLFFKISIQKNATFLVTKDIFEKNTHIKGVYNDEDTVFLIVPIVENRNILGFFSFEYSDYKNKWFAKNYKIFDIFSNILVDVNNSIKTKLQLHSLAYYDELTGLPNKSLFYNKLNELISNDKTNDIGVMLIDLDDFKYVNNTLGHTWGDSVIKEVSRRLLGVLKADDFIARFGGDEFLLLFPNIKRKLYDYDTIEEIKSVFKKPFIINNHEFFISCSGGLSVYPDDGETVNTLLKNADLAMNTVKIKEKKNILIYSSEMKKFAYEKMMITNYLYKAIEQKELSLLYQPKISLETGKVVGVESLLRWNHPSLGPIAPEIFIPIAEENNLIHTIGQWTLNEACAQLLHWEKLNKQPVNISVNVSTSQFRTFSFANFIKNLLNESSINPELLELEITESIFSDDSESITAQIHNLKSLGLKISIDDFGTKFSSLSRLKDLPIDKIKIDKKFIAEINLDKKGETILSSIISMGKNLGLTVIAEGVETEEQKNFLMKEKCDKIQGNYFFPPMSADELTRLLPEL